MTDRRSFLKTAAAASAAAAATPLLGSCQTGKDKYGIALDRNIQSRLIVQKANAVPITGTFLDEISTDIPHQNWGEAEWDRDFQYMKKFGIDTVIIIRCGLRKWMTYPSPYLLKKGYYYPSVDLVDMFCRLAEKHGMSLYIGLYDSDEYWYTGVYNNEIEINKFIIDELWERYGHYKSFKGWYLSYEISRRSKGAIEGYQKLGQQCKELSKSKEYPNGYPTFISPIIEGIKGVSAQSAQLRRADRPDIMEHMRDWDEIFEGIHEFVDACAFQDGYNDYDEIEDYISVNKMLADKWGIHSWTNCESFDRDMPIKFLPIKFDKLRLKLEAAKRCGVEKAITFEFSHFISPQSAYLQAGHLYDRYLEYFGKRI